MLAVIPARGGSKRIPHKNIKDFNGLPLIGYSIRAARDSGIFRRIIVSTDDREIAATAERLGAEVPFLRPAALADDFTGTQAVTLDALSRAEAAGEHPTAVCCIYATAPLLTGAYLQRAAREFVAARADLLYACCEFPFPVQRGFYLDDGRPVPFMRECLAMRSQDLPPVYQDAGLFYFYSPTFLHGTVASPERRGFVMPRHRVIDIDTPEDFRIAQAMAQAIAALNLD